MGGCVGVDDIFDSIGIPSKKEFTLGRTKVDIIEHKPFCKLTEVLVIPLFDGHFTIDIHQLEMDDHQKAELELKVNRLLIKSVKDKLESSGLAVVPASGIYHRLKHIIFVAISKKANFSHSVLPNLIATLARKVNREHMASVTIPKLHKSNLIGSQTSEVVEAIAEALRERFSRPPSPDYFMTRIYFMSTDSSYNDDLIKAIEKSQELIGSRFSASAISKKKESKTNGSLSKINLDLKTKKEANIVTSTLLKESIPDEGSKKPQAETLKEIPQSSQPEKAAQEKKAEPADQKPTAEVPK